MGLHSIQPLPLPLTLFFLLAGMIFLEHLSELSITLASFEMIEVSDFFLEHFSIPASKTRMSLTGRAEKSGGDSSFCIFKQLLISKLIEPKLGQNLGFVQRSAARR